MNKENTQLSREEIDALTPEPIKKEREELISELKIQQHERRERRQGVRQRIQELLTEAEGKKKEVEEIVGQIAIIETQIREKRKQFIKLFLEKIISFNPGSGISELEKRLRVMRGRKSMIDEEWVSKEVIIADLQKQLADNTQNQAEFAAARERLTQLYAKEKNAAWEAYQEDERARDVANISEKYQVTFVHGIQVGFLPGGSNSPLRGHVDWKLKFKILFALNPEISTSTIQRGQGVDRLWSHVGVILNGGRVLQAGGGDIGSVVEKGKRVSEVKKGQLQKLQMSGEIAEAIKGFDVQHNELAVEKPVIAGVYVCLDNVFGFGLHQPPLPGMPSAKDLQEQVAGIARELGIPLYALIRGEVHEAIFDEEKKCIVPKNNVVQTPRDLRESKFVLKEERRKEILQGILEDAPFRITSPEVGYLHSRTFGREAYVAMNAGDNMSKLVGREEERIDYPGTDREKKYRVKIIAEFYNIGLKIQYYVKPDGALIREVQDIHSHTEDSYDLSEDHKRTMRGEIMLSEGFGGLSYSRSDLLVEKSDPFEYKLGEKILSNEDYLQAMERAIAACAIKKEAATQKGESEIAEKEFQEKRLNQFAFHLYGFAEQAREWGDVETAVRAEAIASRVVSREQFQEVFSRRMGGHGELKITLEDFK